MFRPRTSHLSREDFLESDGDLVIDDVDVQGVRAGALRLLPTSLAPQPHEFSWPVVAWDQEDELRSFSGEIDGKWVSLFNAIPVTVPQQFPFEQDFLDVDTELGEYLYLRQKTGGAAGKRFWADTVANATGWTIQTRLRVLEDDTGTPHQIVLDDGTRREILFLHAGGISFEQNPSLNISADMTVMRELRIGARQDDIYVLLDNGQGVAGVDGYTGPSLDKELAIGLPSADGSRHRTLFDYLHQFHGGLWVDERPNVARTYSTIPSTAITLPYAPRKRVSRFDEAIVETSWDSFTGGDTTIVVEYRSSATGMIWTALVGSTLVDAAIERIPLTSIPTAGDATDQVRFRVTQVSDDGSAEPPRVERITVLTTFGADSLGIVPRWGPTVGGSTHALNILAAARDAFLGAGPLTGLAFHAPFDADFDDTIGPLVGTPAGDTALVDDGYGGAARLGELTETPDAITDVLDAFVEHAPYGMIGTGLAPVWTGGALVLTQSTISSVEGGALVERTAQRVTADELNGVKVPGYASIGAVRILLQIIEGSVEVSFNGVSRIFRIGDFWTPRVLAIDVTGTSDLEIKAITPVATFAFAPLAAYFVAAGSVAYGSPANPTSGLGMDLFFKPSLFQPGVMVSRRTGSNGWEIGMLPDGSPYAWIGDGTLTDQLDSFMPLRIDQWNNVALIHRIAPDHTGLQLLVDGEIVGEKITAISSVSAGTGLTVGGVPGRYDQVRVHAGTIDAARFGAANGLANPTFESAYSVPLEAANKLVLRFGQTKGVFADDSGRYHHAHLIPEWRAGLRRDEEFQGRPATLFWFNGAIGVLHTPDFIQDVPLGVFARGIFRLSAAVQEIASKWNAAGTIGWKIEILTDGLVRVTTEDGVNSRVLTSDEVLADDTEKAVHAQIESTGITLRVGPVEKTLTASVGSLAAATEDMEIGKGLTAYLGEFVFRKDTLSLATYTQWADPSVVKWTPSGDVVLVDGVALAAERVLHYSPVRKYISMPPHYKANVPVFVETQGVTLDAERPFIYALNYERPVAL